MNLEKRVMMGVPSGSPCIPGWVVGAWTKQIRLLVVFRTRAGLETLNFPLFLFVFCCRTYCDASFSQEDPNLDDLPTHLCEALAIAFVVQCIIDRHVLLMWRHQAYRTESMLWKSPNQLDRVPWRCQSRNEAVTRIDDSDFKLRITRCGRCIGVSQS
ncbi:hypothetical protein EDD18DRAFT_293513 [Armillaria luteobubalina]|uniref:Uncharacterized protein n=1 Tax=Armillaria luteobubalina TaxID=153913 RepID=A0AA39Q2M4_9AGAR|nr:hypothetical protein EDD18DRAFT_293513 [Armillaria luteobubalina]